MDLTSIDMIKLTAQSFLILILGMVLWRLMVAYSKKKSKPKGSTFFDTKYKDQWKRRY